MPRRKKVIYYTVPEYADTLLVPVESTRDTEQAREQAIEELFRMMEDDNETLLSEDSFPDGVGVDRLVLVEPPPSTSRNGKKRQSKTTRELTPVEEAAADIARFSMLRVSLQEAQEAAKPYFSLIETLLGSEMLTPEQIEMARSKDLAKVLNNLATAKADCDEFKPKAQEAWELLKSAFAGVQT